MNTLAGIGMGLVGIFLPIYLLELGFPLTIVISWLLTHHLSLLLGAFLAIFVSNKIGLARCWYIRTTLLALLFCGLYFLPEHHSLVFLLGFISGIESAFFWIPYNILTVRKTVGASIGTSLALISNISSIVGIGIPLASALIIVHYGYSVLFFVAFLFVLISLVPVIPMSQEKTHFEFSRKAMRDIALKNRNFILPEILDNLGQDAGVLWFLFIFVTGLTVLDLGILGVISSLAGIAITHLTGRFIDTRDKHKIIRFGAILTTLAWIASYMIAEYAPTPLLLYIVTTIRGFAIGIFSMSYGAVMFNRARRSHDAQFLVLREIPTILGRIIVFTLALILISLNNFELTFILVELLSAYFWFTNLKSLTHN